MLGSEKPLFFEALGASWGVLGVLEHLGGGFERPGAISKGSWLHLGVAWPLFVGLLGPLGGILAPSWGHPGAILGHLGALGRVSGGVSEAS